MELKDASRSNNKVIRRYNVYQATRSTLTEYTAERSLDELINAFIDGELYIMTEVYAHQA